MRKIFISAVFFLSVTTFAQTKEETKTWELLLANKRNEARTYFDKNLKEQKLQSFESLFLDALIDEEMGEMVFDESFVKNFTSLIRDESYLYPIVKKKFIMGDFATGGFDDYSYKKIDFLAQDEIFRESTIILEFKNQLDRLRNEETTADKSLAKIKRIDKWQYAGVFENLNGSGLYNDYEPETYPKSDKLFNANSLGYVGWYTRKFSSNDGFDFFINESEYGRGIMYAQTFIENPSERKILLEVNTSSEFRLFLNDTEVMSSSDLGHTNLGAHLLEVTLPKGMNRMLLKFDVKESADSFMVIPFTEDYKRIFDLTYYDSYKEYQKSSLADLKPKELPLRFEKKLKENLQTNPDSFFYKYLLVSGYISNNQNDQAKELIDDMVKSYPKSSLVQCLLSQYYGNTDNAEKIFEVLKNMEVNDPEYFIVPTSKMLDGQKFEALSIAELEKYRDILSTTKAKGFAEFYDVVIAHRKRDVVKAKAHIANLKKSFANNEKFFVIFNNLDNLDNKDQSALIKTYEDFLSEKTSIDVLYALYSLYEGTNRIEDQKKTLKTLIKIYPTINSFRTQYLNLLNNSVENKEYAEELENALSNFPYSYSLLAEKAEYLAKINRKNEALDFAKRSLSHNTNNEMMHKLVRDLDKSEEEIDKVAVKDLYKLSKERKNKITHGKKGVTTLLDEYIVNIYSEGGIKKRSTYLYEITSEKGIDEMKEQYFNYNERVLKAEVLKPDGSIVPADESDEQMVFTNLAVGDVILVQKESLERSSGRFYKDFNLSSYFNSEYPVIESVFTIITPKGVSYEVKSNNAVVASTKKNIGNKTYETWKLNNLDELFDSEYFGPGYYDATISVTANSIKTWEEISNWYADLSRKSLVSDQVTRKVFTQIFPSGVAGMTDAEKAEKIYTYIEKNISYSSVDFRQSGYIPQKPSKTLSSKLGDCKDLSTLFVILGNQAGLKSNLVLVQTNDYPAQSLLLPNINFNHCIVKVNLDGKETFLEMTDKYLPFNSIVRGNYNAKGLVIPMDKSTPGSQNLINIPSVNNVKSLFKTKTNVIIKDDEQSFVSKQYVMGETKSYYNDFFQDSQAEETRKKKIEQEFGSSLDKVIKVKSVNLIDGKNLTSQPLSFEVDYSITEKPQSVGSLKIVKIPFLTKPFTADVIATEIRKTDIYYTKYEKQSSYLEEISLNIPLTMKFIEIPENKTFEYGNFKYSINFDLQSNNILKITRFADTPWDNIKKEDYPAFKKFVEEIINTEDQILGYK